MTARSAASADESPSAIALRTTSRRSRAVRRVERRERARRLNIPAIVAASPSEVCDVLAEMRVGVAAIANDPVAR
jgi:hypothetical protein